MSDFIDDHQRFLDDPFRMNAFARAIAEVVRPGDVVADLGSGTGILGFLACRAGAARVFAVEKTGLSAVARRIAIENGFDDRFVMLHGHSRDIELPERVDVVVSDMVGSIGVIRGGAEALRDASRWLKPGGRMIPAAVATWIAPVEHADMYRLVDFWSAPVAGIDMAALRKPAANTQYPHQFVPDDLLAAGQSALSLDYRGPAPDVVRGTASFVVHRAGTLHGIAAWCVAQLTVNVSYTNAPGAAERIRRHHGFFPVDPPIAVRAGDRVDVDLTIRPLEFVIAWQVECRRGPDRIGESRQSTFAGMMLTSDDLSGTALDVLPAGASGRPVA